MSHGQAEISGDLFISETLRRIIRWWWVIGLAMIVGGVCGLLISKLQKPLYESTSVITTSIDFAYAGRLDDYKEDHLITAIGDIIRSTVVFSEVQQDLIDSGIEVSPEKLDESTTLSRQGYRWELSARDKDPGLAKKINQVWLDAAIVNLQEMRSGSIQAVHILARQQSIESCISQSVVVDPVSAGCSPEKMNELIMKLEEYGDPIDSNLIEKLLLSQISFQVTQAPSHPVKPVQLGTNLSTLAGALAGLIMILLLVLFYPPRRS